MTVSELSNVRSATKINKLKLKFLTAILVMLFVVPVLYDYYKFLPGAVSNLVDLLVLIYLIRFPSVLKIRSTFTSLYLFFLIGLLLVTGLSIIIHAEGIQYLIQEFRRLLFPLLFYMMITDYFKTSETASVDLHKVFMYIFMLQIPVTIFQILTYHQVKSAGLFAKALIPFVDAGAGTLGAAGHVYLGILIPLFILYLYDLGKIKYTIPFIIPIILTNSGGGLILSLTVFALLFANSLMNGSFVYRVRSFAGMIFFAALFVLAANTEFFGEHINRYVKSFTHYNTAFIQGGQETWGEGYNQIKIDRFNGYKFLSRKMERYDHEQWLGLGFTFKDNNGHTPYRYKNELNYFIAERGYLGLAIYGLFIVLFLMYLTTRLFQNKYKAMFAKLVFFVAFFLSGFYNPNTRSFQVWISVVFVSVLYENRDQYLNLVNRLKDKPKLNRTFAGVN